MFYACTHTDRRVMKAFSAFSERHLLKRKKVGELGVYKRSLYVHTNLRAMHDLSETTFSEKK